ncbi:TPA: YlxQ-related RNA-binding protein [Streptococcus suis]|nr:YlxQ-related RNA-binding protein [Streptococcus suis]
MLTTRSKGESLDSNKTQKILNLLGLAQRAGRLISGEELVVEAIQKKQAKLVYLAEDAGPNLRKKITDKSQTYQIEVVTAFSTLELSAAVGKSRKVLAVTDAGFTKKMRSIME